MKLCLASSKIVLFLWCFWTKILAENCDFVDTTQTVWSWPTPCVEWNDIGVNQSDFPLVFFWVCCLSPFACCISLLQVSQIPHRFFKTYPPVDDVRTALPGVLWANQGRVTFLYSCSWMMLCTFTIYHSPLLALFTGQRFARVCLTYLRLGPLFLAEYPWSWS